MQFITTLRLIMKHGPCKNRLPVLKQALPKPDDLDAEIPVAFILEHNGLSDAVWSMQAVHEAQQEASRRCLVGFCADLAQRALTLHLANVPTKVDVVEAIRLLHLRRVAPLVAGEAVAQMSQQLLSDHAQLRRAGLPWNIVFASAAVKEAFEAVCFLEPWEAACHAQRELEAAAEAAKLPGGMVEEYREHVRMFARAMGAEE